MLLTSESVLLKNKMVEVAKNPGSGFWQQTTPTMLQKVGDTSVDALIETQPHITVGFRAKRNAKALTDKEIQEAFIEADLTEVYEAVQKKSEKEVGWITKLLMNTFIGNVYDCFNKAFDLNMPTPPSKQDRKEFDVALFLAALEFCFDVEVGGKDF